MPASNGGMVLPESPLGWGPGYRHGLAGQHLVAHRRMIHEGSDDYSRLHHVASLDAIINIHVGVVGSGAVIDFILNELKSGQTDAVKGLMVGAASIPDC